MKRRIVIVIALMITVVLLIWKIRQISPPEPSYRGKSLRAWLDDRQITPNQQLVLSDEATEAVRNLGPAALPALLAWMEQADSLLVRQTGWLQRKTGLPVALADHQAERTRALDGFRALGAAGQSAWPALVEIILHSADNRQVGDAMSALTVADSATMRLLAQALQDPDPRVRSNAIAALKFLRIAPDEVCLPAIERLSNDPHPGIRLLVANTILDFTDQLTKAVPSLKDPDPTVRVTAAQTIGEYRTRASAFLPDLEAAQADTDTAVRAAVSRALQQVQGK